MDAPIDRPAPDSGSGAAHPSDEGAAGTPGDDEPSTGATNGEVEPGADRHPPRRQRGRHTGGVEEADEDDDGVTLAEIDQAAGLAGARAERLVEDLIEVELETGRREETVEAAQRHILVRIARVGAGVVVLLLGIAMLGLPGPGFLVIALGLALLAQDVPFARRLLEKVRARLPQDEDGKLPRSTVISMIVVGVGAVALSIGFTVWQLTGD